MKDREELIADFLNKNGWGNAERRQSEAKVRTQMFMDALDVDDMIAHLLVAFCVSV